MSTTGWASRTPAASMSCCGTACACSPATPTSRPTASAGSTSTPARGARPCPTASSTGLHGYTSSLYEQDGVIYQIRHAWSPTPTPVAADRLLHHQVVRRRPQLGRPPRPQERPAADRGRCHVPGAALELAYLRSVRQGRRRPGGGSRRPVRLPHAPASYLVRMPRKKLANLNKADFQYYKGAPLDGMLDSSWSSVPADAGKIIFAGPNAGFIERRLQLRPEALCRDRGPGATRRPRARSSAGSALRDLHRRAPLGALEADHELRHLGPRGLEHADGQQVHVERRPEDVVRRSAASTRATCGTTGSSTCRCTCRPARWTSTRPRPPG